MDVWVAESPCEWCGRAIWHQRRPGQRRRYCGRGCRQRAYEVRSAEARLERDLATGAVRAEPAVRVVEVEAPAPQYHRGTRIPTGHDWLPLLDHLARQLDAGLTTTATAERIAAAARTVTEAAERLQERTEHLHTTPPPPAPTRPEPPPEPRPVAAPGGAGLFGAPAPAEPYPPPPSASAMAPRTAPGRSSNVGRTAVRS